MCFELSRECYLSKRNSVCKKMCEYCCFIQLYTNETVLSAFYGKKKLN